MVKLTLKKAIILVLFTVLMGSVALADVSEKVMRKVDQATCAVSSYFEMSEGQMQRFGEKKGPISHPFITVPMGQIKDSPNYVVAYIGAGTLLKDNYVLTVRHMVRDEDGTAARNVYCIFDGIDHAIEARVVFVSEGKDFADDYALLKLGEDIKRQGLKFAGREFKHGEWVIYSGSTGGLAFWTRVGHAVDLRYYLYKGEADGILHLGMFENFAMTTVYPGGPGDSGGSIKNEKGEIIGLMYCGLSLYDECYIFSNPLWLLEEFLIKNDMAFLLK